MARVLVIEDEHDLQEILQYNLRQAGHEVFAATTGQEGLRLARSGQPEVILLDIMLPDMPGTEIARALRRDRATEAVPFIMVTAKGEEVDRVVGLELGADDYVVKPFSVRELLLRIQAVLKRSGARAQEPTGVTQFGCLRLDRPGHRTWVEDKEVELTNLEFKLLLVLLDRRGRVQTRNTLLRDVWDIAADVTTRTVDTHVKRLREKLGAAGGYIETVRGVGYRFSEAPRVEAT
ncbi:MAG: response regulator transcription factor [Myxococcota bacterium]